MHLISPAHAPATMSPDTISASPTVSSNTLSSKEAMHLGDEKTPAMPASTEITDPEPNASDKGRLDVAAEFLKLHEGEHGSYSAAEARKVLWKIDVRLIPLMTLTVALCAVDVRSPSISTEHIPRIPRLTTLYRKLSSPTQRYME